MRLKSTSENSRPRERIIQKGPQSLSDVELLALILGSGTKKMNVLELSNYILNKYDLATLSRMQISGLSEFEGIGKARACQMVACFELARRVLATPEKKRQQIDSASDIAKYLMPNLSFMDNEHFIAVYLDTRRRVIGEKIISAGSLNSVALHPRDIFYNAITEKAAAVILAHNHPSGDTSPSDEDIEVTKDIISAGKLLGIEILDHIIFGNNSYRSMREKEDLYF